MRYSQFQYCHYQSTSLKNITLKYYDSRYNPTFCLNSASLYLSFYLMFNFIRQQKVLRYKSKFTIWQSSSFKKNSYKQVQLCLSGDSVLPHLEHLNFSPVRGKFVAAVKLHLSLVNYSTNRLIVSASTSSRTPRNFKVLLKMSSQLYFQFAHLYTTHYWLTSSLLHQTVKSMTTLFGEPLTKTHKTDKGSYALLSVVRNLKYL